jgi:hypothetical protein
MTDYQSLARRYVEHVRRAIGKDLLGDGCGFSPDDVRALRGSAADDSLVPRTHKTGGNTPAEIEELRELASRSDDREAAVAWQTEEGR